MAKRKTNSIKNLEKEIKELKELVETQADEIARLNREYVQRWDTKSKVQGSEKFKSQAERVGG